MMQGLQPRVFLAVALICTAITGQAQIREPDPIGLLPPLDMDIAEQIEFRAELLSPAGLEKAPQFIHAPGASFIKVHFAAFNVPPGVLVEVSNPEGTEVYRYHHYSRDGLTVDRSRGDDGVTRFSAMSISGDTAVVRIVGFLGRFNPKIHRVVVDSFTQGAPEVQPQQTVSHIERALNSGKSKTEIACGSDERYDSVCWNDSYPDQYDRSRPVAMLISPHGFECTAWRVGSDNRLITAQHCLPSQEDLDGSEIWFNYEAAACGGNASGQEVKVSGGQLLATDDVLDYTLFTIDDFEKVTQFGNLGLDVRNGSKGENIFIPQHGRGDPKQIAIESDRNDSGLCEIDSESRDVYGDDTDIGYYCDTTTNSSGSPVISSLTGKVIALHHMGGCYNMGAKISRIWPQISSHFGGTVPKGDSDANWAPSNEVPEASYFSDCNKLSCNFDAVESYDADGAIAAYQWNFGDGSDSSGLIVDHQFQDQGKFSVSLTVEDDEGATDTYTTQVVVTKPNQAPSAKFSIACVENRCTVNGGGSEDSDGEIEQWTWAFGDGSSATGQQAVHEFSESGSFTITLTVSDDEGSKAKTSHGIEVQMPNVAPQAAFSFDCQGNTCRFDASNSIDSDGEITKFLWELGDGSSSSQTNFEHSYRQEGSFTVSLTVHDNRGKFGMTSQNVEVTMENHAPTARFKVSCDGLTCTLDAGASTDNDGSIASYAWTFGDGASGSGDRASHEFPGNGKYRVRLVVTDDKSAESSQIQMVRVEAPREIKLRANSVAMAKGAPTHLKWTGAGSKTVAILRNGKHIADAPNNGRFLDTMLKRFRKEARYQVCEPGTSICSNEVLVRMKI